MESILRCTFSTWEDLCSYEQPRTTHFGENVVNLAGMVTAFIGYQVTGWFPEVNVTNYLVLHITEHQKTCSLFITGTNCMALMYSTEDVEVLPNMSVKIPHGKDKVTVFEVACRRMS